MTARVTLTYREVAEAFGVTPKHIANLVQRGEIKAIHLGKRRLVPMSEVERLVEEGAA